MNLTQNERTHFGAAALHEGELFLSEDMLAEGEPMMEEMRDPPEDLTENRAQAQAQAMKEKGGRTEQPTRDAPMRKVPAPKDIWPSAETMERLTGQGITQTQIEKSVGEFLKRATGLDTLEGWQDRLDNKWMVKERVPTGQREDLGGVPFPADYRAGPWLDDFVQKLKMTNEQISSAYMQFVYNSRAATGFKALSRDWDARLAEFLLREDARIAQHQKQRSGPAI